MNEQATHEAPLVENLCLDIQRQVIELLPRIYARVYPDLSKFYAFKELDKNSSARETIGRIAHLIVEEKIATATHQREVFLAALAVVKRQGAPDERIDDKVIEAQRCWFNDHLRYLHYMKECVDNYLNYGKF